MAREENAHEAVAEAAKGPSEEDPARVGQVGRRPLIATPEGESLLDPEHRVLWRDAGELAVRHVRPAQIEEAAHLEPPALQIGAQDRHLVRVSDLGCTERVASRSQTKLATPGHAQVSHPLRLAARRDQVAHSPVVEQVHWNRAPLSTLPSA